MAHEDPAFASRHVHRWSHSDYTRFDFLLPGWSPRSAWGMAKDDHWVLLRDDEDRSRSVELWAEPRGAAMAALLVPTVVEAIDVEPEAVVRAMGDAMPHPLLRWSAEMKTVLAHHESADEPGSAAAGSRAALEWMLGRRAERPGSGRPWGGGQPDPWQVDAEVDMAKARVVRGDPEPGPNWLAGARDRLQWALISAGPLVPEPGEWQRWWSRRRRGEPDLPALDVPGPGCRIGRGRRFRSWQVVNRDGLLGTVEPAGRWRRWVATNHRGGRISERVHRHLPAAAYEVAAEAFHAGRTGKDPERFP